MRKKKRHRRNWWTDVRWKAQLGEWCWILLLISEGCAFGRLGERRFWNKKGCLDVGGMEGTDDLVLESFLRCGWDPWVERPMRHMEGLSGGQSMLTLPEELLPSLFGTVRIITQLPGSCWLVRASNQSGKPFLTSYLEVSSRKATDWLSLSWSGI